MIQNEVLLSVCRKCNKNSCLALPIVLLVLLSYLSSYFSYHRLFSHLQSLPLGVLALSVTQLLAEGIVVPPVQQPLLEHLMILLGLLYDLSQLTVTEFLLVEVKGPTLIVLLHLQLVEDTALLAYSL